jgi:hypothetical protein
MNHRIAKKILKNIIHSQPLKYSAHQIDTAERRRSKHTRCVVTRRDVRPECESCGTFIDEPGLCLNCTRPEDVAAGAYFAEPEHDPREGGE